MALKLLHTADWHLGQTFFGYDREYEHEVFLLWLTNTLVEEQTDVLLIAGDIFDVANPAATAQHRFFRFLKEAKNRCPQLQTVIIAGNHDSAARLEAPSPLLEELNASTTGVIKRNEKGEIDLNSLILPLYNKEGKREALCLCVPYLRQGDYPPSEEKETGNTFVAGVKRMYSQLTEIVQAEREDGEAVIAMGHLYAGNAELSENDRSERIVIGGLESIPADIFDEALAYTALGHIHKAQRVGGKEHIRYSGSPLPMSFSETKYNHQVVSVTIENGTAIEITPISVPISVELLRIPASPQPPSQVIEELMKLPDRTGEETELYPYAEVRVLLTEPDPGFRHRVEEIIKGKAIRLTSIVTSYPKSSTEANDSPQTFSDLQSISPLTMLEHSFATKYGNELPDTIKGLFNEVLKEVSE